MLLGRCVSGLFCLPQLHPGCIYTSIPHAARPLPSKHDYALASIAFEVATEFDKLQYEVVFHLRY